MNLLLSSEIRKIICDKLHEISSKSFLPIKDCVRLYCEYLYNTLDSSELDNVVQSSLIQAVIFLDTYKMLSYKIKNNSAELLEVDMFSTLYEIEDFSDLEALISSTPPTFEYMVEQSYYFNSINELGKILMIESLSEQENKKLSKISCIHENDLKYYNRKLSLKKISTELKKQHNFLQEVMIVYCDETTIMSILGFLRQLYMFNPNKALKIYNELIEQDYRICKYLSNHGEVDYNDRVDLYENNTREVIINKVIHDQDLAFKILQLLQMKIFSKDCNDINFKDIEVCKDKTLILHD